MKSTITKLVALRVPTALLSEIEMDRMRLASNKGGPPPSLTGWVLCAIRRSLAGIYRHQRAKRVAKAKHAGRNTGRTNSETHPLPITLTEEG